MLVGLPVINIHGSKDCNSPYITQALLGEKVTVLKNEENWCFIQTQDGYQGYVETIGLINDRPTFQYHKDRTPITAIASLVYKEPHIEGPHFIKLPYGVYVIPHKTEGRFTLVELACGTKGWILTKDIEKSTEDLTSFAKRFLNLPYIWGGRSSFGFDCSGFIQMLIKTKGILLPRDSHLQEKSPHLEPADEIKAGDILFFGEGKVTHVGLYIGDDQFIHAGVRDRGCLQISNLKKTEYTLYSRKRLKKISFEAKIEPVLEKPHSWKENSPIPLSDLRKVSLPHYNFEGLVLNGELMVHSAVVEDVIAIFRELFLLSYPIEKMALIDHFASIDELSCEANNSSGYCCRPITGSDSEWSFHSYGVAIDINPLLNPYQKEPLLIPKNGAPFLDRSAPYQGLINKQDACYRAFHSKGWSWGGDFLKERGYADYQHFYKINS